MDNIMFLTKRFSEYYKKNYVKFPANINKREFGIGSFGKKIVKRHLSFDTSNKFNEFLRKNTPLFVSYSNAYYKYPSKTPMEKKEFINADIVYEFDADNIPTNCKKKHDSWQCKNCKKTENGAAEKCPYCGSDVILDQWFCKECLEETKKETIRLANILESDFGIEWIKINFSGNAGYHIHIEDEAFKRIPQYSRIELLDYLCLENIDLELHNFFFDGKIYHCPKKDEINSNIDRRIIDRLKAILSKDGNFLASISNIRTKKAMQIINKKEKIFEKIDNGILIPLVKSTKRSVLFWNSLLKHIIDELKLHLDRQTSLDIGKLVRVPNTLHGGTALLAKYLTLDELKGFNPFNDAVVFGTNRVRVFINKAPRFYLADNSFGPYDNCKEEIEEYAALYLIAKGKATLV